MKWYTGINESGLAVYGEHLRAAVWSAVNVAGLEPHIIYDGDVQKLRDVLPDQNITIHPQTTSLLREILAMPPTPGWSPEIATGAYLRLEIPQVEQDEEFVLYTDNDVLFTKQVDLTQIRPKLAAGAIEPTEDGSINRCSGVLVLNVPSLRREYDAMMERARRMLGSSMYDQDVYNAHLKGKWDELPLRSHWKPFWGINPSANIVHFIGPKFTHIRAIASGTSDLPGSHILCWLYGLNPISCRYYAKLGGHYAKAVNSPADAWKSKLTQIAGPLYGTRLASYLPL